MRERIEVKSKHNVKGCVPLVVVRSPVSVPADAG